VNARLETLLYRYEQPTDQSWGIDPDRGFRYDWWHIGGRYQGWGLRAKELMKRRGVRPSRHPIPRFLARNAVRSDDLAQVRLTSRLLPVAVLTPHGEWEEYPGSGLPNFGKATVRQRKARARWTARIRALMGAYPECLAVAVDYHD
jgi:hypothetical protein